MWMELLQIFSSGDPLKGMADDFMRMLSITHEMADIVRPHVYDHNLGLDERKRILDLDVQVNMLERGIRKRIISHLAISHSHVAYCLLLFSLVKDAERIGDYVKNISEVEELGGGSIPQGQLRDELTDLIGTAMHLFEETPKIIAEQDRDRANELLVVGRNANKRSDKLLVALAKSELNASQTTAMVLLTRFYKRLSGHLLNILSSVVMPVHKVDYYDEDLVKSPAP